MLWFFERDDESLKLETRYDNDTSEFVVIVRHPDGREHTERFTDGDAYGAWLETFERSLEHQHWTRRGGPVIMPDGWPNKRLTWSVPSVWILDSMVGNADWWNMVV